MSELIIRKACEHDVLKIEEIEKQCFSVPWSFDSLHYDVTENKLALYVVAEIDNNVCGYAGIWKVVDEGHITNVAVSPLFRRRHIASAMLSVIIDITAGEDISRYTLEVRRSNEAAIKLYETLGFVAEGVRKGYYDDNGEDAIIMWKNL